MPAHRFPFSIHPPPNRVVGQASCLSERTQTGWKRCLTPESSSRFLDSILATIFRKILLSLLFVFSAAISGLRAAENPLPLAIIEGVWRWDFTMPDGTTVTPRLMLHRSGDALRGTTSFRPGSATAITNVAFSGGLLRFQVTRPGPNGEVITTYTGRQSGTNLTGMIESNWAGEKQNYDWMARQVHAGVGGTWRWTTKVAGRDLETRVVLQQEGERVTGFALGRGGRGSRDTRAITNGLFKNGEINFELPSFQSSRSRGANAPPVRYRGAQRGDLIQGTIISMTSNVERITPWEAQRDE